MNKPITMLRYEDRSYIYNELSKRLYVVDDNGKFETRVDVDKVETDKEFNFSYCSRCFGIWKVYDVHLSKEKCQIYDDKSRVFKTMNGNLYFIDAVKHTVSGVNIPGGESIYDEIKVNDNCELEIKLADENKGIKITTDKIYDATLLSVYKCREMENYHECLR